MRRLARRLGAAVDEDPTVALGAVVAALVAVSLWSGAVVWATGAVARGFGGLPSALLVVPFVAAVALVVGAAGYARFRGFAVRLSAPRRGTWPTAVAAVVAPVALVAVASAVAVLGFGTSLGAATGRLVSPSLSPLGFLLRVAPPSAMVGLGYGVVVCWVVVESVDGVVAPEDVSAVAALLVGVFWLLPLGIVARLPVTAGAAFEFAATLVFGAAFGGAVGAVHRSRRAGAWVPSSRRGRALLALAVVGLAGVGTGLEPVETLLWLPALAATVVGYRRTRSVLVAALTMSAFTVSLRAVGYVEAVLGVGGL